MSYIRFYINALFIVLLTMTSCSQDEEGNVTYDSEKTPILFTVGQTGVSPLTRAVVSGGEPARAFTKDTRLFLYMEAENSEKIKKKWGCNYGTAAGVADAADGRKSAVAFNGNSLYWDDAFARDTKLTVYSLAMANSMAESMRTTSPDVTLSNTTSRTLFTEADEDISPTVSITLGKDNKQDVTSVSQQDLVFSNNVSELSGHSRMKYNQGTKLFDKGELVYNHALASMTFKLNAGKGFDGVDDFECGVYAHVGGEQHVFEFVEHVFDHFRLAGHGTGQFLKQSLLGFLETVVEGFAFFFFREYL